MTTLPSYDQIKVNGAVTFSGVNRVDVADGTADGIYDIFTAASAMALDAGDFAPVTGADDYSWVRGSSVHLNDTEKTLQLTLSTASSLALT